MTTPIQPLFLFPFFLSCLLPCVVSSEILTTKETSTIYSDGEEMAAHLDCHDLRSQCPHWKESCSDNPIYMHVHCPVTCGVCDKVGRRTVPSQYSFALDYYENRGMRDAVGRQIGAPQIVPKNYSLPVRRRVERAIHYVENVVKVEKRFQSVVELCQNYDSSCAYWAILGECETNFDWMNENCAPVCFTCEHLHVEALCPIDPYEKDSLYPGDVNRLFDNLVTHPYYRQAYNLTVWSRPEYAPGDNPDTADYLIGPWVVTLDGFLSEKESETLIELGAEIGYERSTDVGDLEEDGSFEEVVSRGRTSTNAWCNEPVCYDHEDVKAVQSRILNVTTIPTDRSEYFQLLRYEPGQFYNTHHDYIPQELERRQGVRILTVFLYLNQVEEGGETNFPKLDLTVAPKTGRVLIWPSVLDEYPNQMDARTDHRAMPVIKGIKYGANAWIHQRALKDECQ